MRASDQRDEVTPRVGSDAGRLSCRSTTDTTDGVSPLFAAGASRSARADAIAALREAICDGVVAGIARAVSIAP